MPKKRFLYTDTILAKGSACLPLLHLTSSLQYCKEQKVAPDAYCSAIAYRLHPPYLLYFKLGIFQIKLHLRPLSWHGCHGNLMPQIHTDTPHRYNPIPLARLSHLPAIPVYPLSKMRGISSGAITYPRITDTKCLRRFLPKQIHSLTGYILVHLRRSDRAQKTATFSSVTMRSPVSL